MTEICLSEQTTVNTESVGESGILLLTRSAWICKQKFGTLVWSGDVPSTFEALRMSVKTGLSMAMCGIPWWTTDIGGFWSEDNEIWSFGEETYHILKKLIELRERLRPYIHKYMDTASKTGVSIMRPMFVEYPEDKICYTLDNQYMFGEDILFALTVNQGQTDRKVYLPAGEWIDVNTKKEYKGKEFINANAELANFIAFVKKGSECLRIFDN